ncbi:hypothetical protein HMPREF0063_10081 [Aeromicrobium marinum DSM 15272]|uniref:Uncharacterized protein n=1 Tax=Aeromicrobium marinum DSM 15272 TaxID=585531 RepID=E2S7S4_9ACTN|nr:hypothetical protein [Aeromicrobium marinum]EFQ84740.1 hypothetical protein HMPREF0063_10081 [Aeromicrobium marinum DSM 15272]
MKTSATHTPGKPVVTDDGYVIVSGQRIGQALRLKSRRWIYRERGGLHSRQSWPSREQLLDDLFGHGGWS